MTVVDPVRDRMIIDIVTVAIIDRIILPAVVDTMISITVIENDDHDRVNIVRAMVRIDETEVSDNDDGEYDPRSFIYRRHSRFMLFIRIIAAIDHFQRREHVSHPVVFPLSLSISCQWHRMIRGILSCALGSDAGPIDCFCYLF